MLGSSAALAPTVGLPAPSTSIRWDAPARPGTLAANVPGLAGASHLIDVEGAGKPTVGANAALDPNIGVDLTNPTSPRPFLYDNSAIDLTANASGSNLSFTAAVGPLGLFVKGGSVN